MELLRCLAVAPCTCFCRIRQALSQIRMNLHQSYSSPCDSNRLGTISNDQNGSVSLAHWFHANFASTLLALLVMVCLSGCNFIPDIKHKPQYHNPFPQISKVAILPFRNQSQEATLSGARVSMAYYNELQAIRGFEVIPCGVVENQLAYFETQILRHAITTPIDFQQFAKHLGVDAVLQGAITDYDAYYPPRITMKVNWYAANPGFHPIPVGYGLPWGTKKEKKIPEWIRLDAERALAAEQLKTQTPDALEEDDPTPSIQLQKEEESNVPPLPDPTSKNPEATNHVALKKGRIDAARIELPVDSTAGSSRNESTDVLQASVLQEPEKMPEAVVGIAVRESSTAAHADSAKVKSDSAQGENSSLPANWPDPQGFIPRRPTPQPPEMKAQFEPIISHMRTYNGNDEDFTNALEEYYYFRDDARFGGWQAYLQRSEDFIRFCCHQHIVETLESRGGSLESRMILRWPVGRYER